MRRTPPEVSRKLQEIRRKADVWRAGIAAAAGDPAKVAYGNTQIALCAQEMKAVLKKSKKQFWTNEK